MPAAPFTEAVRRVSLVAERGSAVRLSFGAGQVTIEAETQGRARARETVRADFDGREPVIAFSPHYLLDGTAAAGLTAAAPHAGDPDAGRAEAAPPAGAGSGSGARSGDGPLGPEPAPASRPGATIRLEFNTATKPAVIMGVHADQGVRDFRYLVVPLRATGR